MNHLSRSLFAFAIAGSVAGSAVHAADENQASSAHPRHFADYHTTSVNRETMHAPIYGTFYDEASAAAYRKTPSKYTDESVLGENGKIDTGKIGMIFYESFSNSYYTLGEKVGKAWGEGKVFLNH